MARRGGVSSRSAARANRRASSPAAEEALVTACGEGILLAVKALLASGANANSVTGAGYTALYAACRGGHAGIASLLLGAGADINEPSTNNHTPLYIACAQGHTLVVALLLRHEGLDVNQACKNGSTPLLASSLLGHRRIVKLLLDAGANADARIIEGLTTLEVTALEAAEKGGHRSCVRALKERRCVVCHVTRKTLGRKLKKCGACLRVVYCGEACQAEHWEEHKEVCGAARDNELAQAEAQLASETEARGVAAEAPEPDRGAS